jgi:alkanesulfonate monooxygenase SsuD/methylene tetrahydromethanopterin reductase-like flavin-dependent oxidoreductase (luciferase family)
MDDYLRLTRTLWTEEHTAFQSESYSIPDLGFAPKPARQPHPPIWIGGHTDAALRRAGRLGDAWFAPSNVPDLAGMYARVQDEARKAGRDPATVALTLIAPVDLRPERRDTALQQLAHYRALGVQHLVTPLRGVADLASADAALTVLGGELVSRLHEQA